MKPSFSDPSRMKTIRWPSSAIIPMGTSGWNGVTTSRTPFVTFTRAHSEKPSAPSRRSTPRLMFVGVCCQLQPDEAIAATYASKEP